MNRSYRIVRVAGLHYKSVKNTLDSLFLSKSYLEQQAALFQKGYVYSNSFSKAMQTLGHDAYEIVYDLEATQKKWAQEQGVLYAPARWQEEILLAQIQHLRPDIVFFQDIYAMSFELRKTLKQRFPFLKLVAIFRGFPGYSPSLYRELATADVLFLGSPYLVRKCKKAGLVPHQIYHYFEESILHRIQADPETSLMQECTFSYLGSSGYGYGIEYLERYMYLKKLLHMTPITAWIDEPLSGKEPSSWHKAALRIASKAFVSIVPKKLLLALQENEAMPLFRGIFEELIQGQSIPQHPLATHFPTACHPPLFGMEMYRRLHRSRVTFNKHAGAARGTVDNIRLFHATGMGACLLTDRGSNLSDLFEEDREVVAFSSVEECVEKAQFLIHNEEKSRQIAKNGQMRTLKDHTALKRCEQIDDILQSYLRKEFFK